MAEVYGASAVKRYRRTDAQLAEVDEAIVAAVEEEHPVTLRGVYYRVVSAGAVEKTEAAYRMVGRQLLKLRRAGVIPYDRITDGTRWITRMRAYDDVDQALDDMATYYRRRLWNDQNVSVSIFTEKDAISGVVEPITRSWDVPLAKASNAGYGSHRSIADGTDLYQRAGLYALKGRRSTTSSRHFADPVGYLFDEVDPGGGDG